jgi:hypothetical protein
MPEMKFTVKHAKIENLPAILGEVKRVHETQVQRDLEAYFFIITGDWSAKNRPKIYKRTTVTANAITTYVIPRGDIWKYVTLGTRPHPITPKHGKFLKFKWGGPGSYIPKTRPVAQYGGPGKVTNGTTQYRKKVKHPGNKPRKFEPKIIKEYRPTYLALMREAVKRGVAIAKRGAK